jgi:hypothetical protein
MKRKHMDTSARDMSDLRKYLKNAMAILHLTFPKLE